MLAKKRDRLPTGGQPKFDTSFHIFTDQAASEERLINNETALFVPRRNERLSLRDEVVGNLVHIRDTWTKLELQTLTVIQKVVDNLVSAALQNLVRQTVQKVVRSPKFMARFSNGVIGNAGLVNSMRAHVRSEQQKLETQQAKTEDIYRNS